MNNLELVKELHSRREKFYRLINSFGPDPEEVVQDMCVKLLESKNDYTNNYGNAITLLYTMVKNYCVNEYRKKLRRPTAKLHENIPDDTKEFDNLRLFTVIRDCKELTARDKFVLYNHYWNDCNYDEISEMLNIPSVTLRTSFLKCKRILKQELIKYI